MAEAFDQAYAPSLVDSAEISRQRDLSQINEAWRLLNEALRTAPRQSQSIWIDHIAGRYGDCGYRQQSHRPPAGCLLWEYVRSGLSSGDTDLLALWHDLQAVQVIWFEAAEIILPAPSYRTGHRLGSFARSAQCLIRGALAACRCIVAAQIDARGISPADGTIISGRTATQELAACIDAYHSFWWGSGLSQTSVFAWPPSVASLVCQDHTLGGIASWIHNAWAKIADVIASTAEARLNCAIPLGMARRACDWLLTSEKDAANPPRSQRLWILFAGQGCGTCAQLVVTESPAFELGHAAYPDPIRLGILPLDPTWREAFDHAAIWSRSRSNDSTTYRWHLEFLDERIAQEITTRSPRSAVNSLLLRPMFMEGASASGAMGILLAAAGSKLTLDSRMAISAIASSDGKLHPVRGLYEKLDPSLWWVYLAACIDQLVICPDEHQELQAWIFGLGKHATSNRTDVLQLAATMQQALVLYTRRRCAVDEFARIQLRMAEGELRVVRPKRLDQAIKEGDIVLFTELHMPLKVRIDEVIDTGHKDPDARHKATTQRQKENEDPYAPSQGREAAKKQVQNFQTRIADFGSELDAWLATSPEDILLVTAGPGMGKTWLGLQTSAALYANLSAHWDDMPYMPFWVTCQELDALDPNTGMQDALLTILHYRIRKYGPNLPEEDRLRLERTMADLLIVVAGTKRLVLLIDGWDERPVKQVPNPDWLQQARSYASVVLFSRPLAFSAHPVGMKEWRLVTLDHEPNEIPLFIEKWFGSQDTRGKKLLDQLPLGSPLYHALRTPLLAAIVCWLWQDVHLLAATLRTARLPVDPPRLPENQSGLLRLVLIAYLVKGIRRGKRAPDSDMLEQKCLRPLAERAAQDFRGERWIVPLTTFKQELKTQFNPAFAEKYGLFFRNEIAGGYEILHQSFAEWLVAFHISNYCEECSDDQFLDWLDRAIGIRIADSSWCNVWRMVTGLLPRRLGVIFINWLQRILEGGSIFVGTGSGRILYAENNTIEALMIAAAQEISETDRWGAIIEDSASSEEAKQAAINAVAQIGPAAVAIVPALITLLQGNCDEVTKRCAARALGNIGPAAAAAISELIILLRGSYDEHTKRYAAEALTKIGYTATWIVPELIVLLQANYDIDTKRYAAYALGEIGQAAAVPELIALLQGNYDEIIKECAVQALGRIGRTAAAAVLELIQLLKGNYDELKKQYAAEALGKIGSAAAAAVPVLITLLQGNYGEDTKGCAAQALGRIGPPAAAAVPDLIALLQSKFAENAKWHAATALGRIGPAADVAVPKLIARLQGKFGDNTKWHAALRYAKHVDKAFADVPELIALLRGKYSENTKWDAARRLGNIGPPAESAVSALARLLLDDSLGSNTKAEIVDALKRILISSDAYPRALLLVEFANGDHKLVFLSAKTFDTPLTEVCRVIQINGDANAQ